MFASEVTRAVCPRCRGSMVGSGDQWKCEDCPGTRKHTQVGGSRARRQNSDVQFHHFVWLHQLGAEVAEVMARIVAVSRKEVARLSNRWSREYFTDLEIVNLPCRRSAATTAVLWLSWATAWPSCTILWDNLSGGSSSQNRWVACPNNINRQMIIPILILYPPSSFGEHWEWSVATTEFLHRCILRYMWFSEAIQINENGIFTIYSEGLEITF